MTRAELLLFIVGPLLAYAGLRVVGADASCGALAGVVGDPFTLLLGLAFLGARVWCVVVVPPLLAVYGLWAFWRRSAKTAG